jgi:hypothetical protein
MARYDATFSQTATLVSTFLAIAGESELARRLRPSTRKRGQTIEHAGGDNGDSTADPIAGDGGSSPATDPGADPTAG